MRAVCSCVFLVCLLIGTSASIAAQQTTGEIIGRVVDEQGGALPGVTVTLRGAGVAGTPATVSSESGTYRFPLLPPGSYELEFILEGFATLKRPPVAVTVGSSLTIDATMALGALNETITVAGSAPVVNTAAAEVSTTYNREWVESAPLRRFSYFDLVNSSPGVSANTNIGQSSTAQSMGSSTNENQYQIDGTNISSTPWVSGDAVEEIEVVQLGASAQYGNVQGAVFNIVTRQGSNTVQGEMGVYYQGQALTSRNTPSSVDRGLPYNRDIFRDVSAQLGGPFIRDRLWFFGAYQDQRDYDSQPGVDPLFPAKNDARRMFYKFNVNLSARHRLLHGYHNDYYFIPQVPTLFTAPTTLNLSRGDNPTPNVVYTGVLSNSMVIDARYSGFWLNSSTVPNLDGTPRVLTRYVDDDTGLITGGIENWTENRSYRNSFQTKLSKYADRFMGGSHDMSVGAQYGVHGSDQLTGPNDTITTFSVTGRPSRGTAQLPYHQGAEVTWGAAYLEKAVGAGDFREDLYYRLNVFSIFVPPLRERKADVLLLADHFVERFAKEHGKTVKRIATPAIDMLASYHWPGNVRELENAIERAVVVCDGGVLHSHHLPPTLQTARTTGTVSNLSLQEMVEAVEKDALQDALKTTRGSRATAARLLRTTRRIFNYKVHHYGIDWRRFRNEPGQPAHEPGPIPRLPCECRTRAVQEVDPSAPSSAARHAGTIWCLNVRRRRPEATTNRLSVRTDTMKTLVLLVIAIMPLVLPARPAAAQGFQLPNMQVRSSAFEDGGIVPLRFTSHGQNVQPDFRITGAPDTTKSFVIIMHDIEVALGGNPDDVTHWVAFNIPSPNIPEGKLPEGSVNGNNIRNQPGYMGSGAPLKDRFHHYVWEFYALNASLDLPTGATRDQVTQAMRGKVVAKAAYVGRYANAKP